MYNRELYPFDIDKPETPYIYFNTLDQSVLDKVAGYFSRDLSSFINTKTNLSSIDEAMIFLDKVIISERRKEEAYLSYLKGQIKAITTIEVPDLESNWEGFVKDIQQTINRGESGIQDLQNELARIEKNIANYSNAENKANVHYNQDTISQTSNFLKDLLNRIKINSYDIKTNVAKLLTVIINKFGSSLLEINNNKQLVLKRSELLALIESISQIIIQRYFSKYYALDKKDTSGRNMMTVEKLEQILDQDLTEQINTIITRAKNLPSYKGNIMQAYHINPHSEGDTINARQFYTSSDELLTDSNLLVKQLLQVLTQYKIPEKAFGVIQNKNDLAEINSLVKFLISDALIVHNTGSKGAKPDNVIGYITLNPNLLDPLQNKNISDIYIRIEQISKEIDELVKTLKSINTTKYYQDQAQRWTDTCKKINTLLQDLSKTYHFLAQCFIIEDSTKNYLSLYAREEDGGIADAVHGGSLGPNLEDQLNKIEALTDAGAITMIDKQWLITAILNSGPNMIAKDRKDQLQNYLSLFAAILLFDSQINIAQEAIQSLDDKIDMNVHQIHLFSVNNGYYPLSYVLKLTKDSLSKNLLRIQSEEISDGVTTEIYGYVKQPKDYYKDLWAITAAEAKKTTKIKMKFLVHFVNVLRNLLKDT